MKVCLHVLYHLLSLRAACPAHLSRLNSTELDACLQRTVVPTMWGLSCAE